MFSRLSLLSLLALTVLTSSPAMAQVTRAGDFTVVSAKDPLDNSNRSLAFSASADEDEGLAWKCLGDGMNVILTFDKWIPDDRGRQLLVRHQFDRDSTVTIGYWTLARDGKAAYLPLRDVPAFTELAKSNKRVVIRVSNPLYAETYTFDFKLSKLGSALGRIGTCR
jgi:hypothetical protein